MAGGKKLGDVTSFAFQSKSSGRSVETGLEGRRRANIQQCQRRYGLRGGLKGLDFIFGNLVKGVHLHR